MKIGLRTGDEALAQALELLAQEQGDTLLRMSALPGEEQGLLCDRILLDLDSAEGRTEELPLTVSISFDQSKSPMLLRPFSEDALRRALQAAPEEGGRYGDSMLAFEGGALYCCGRRLPLSPREAQVFALLYYHQGSPVSPETIAKEIWKDEGRVNDVHVYIRYLRKKLDEPLGRTCILTVRGQGFRLRLPGAEPNR